MRSGTEMIQERGFTFALHAAAALVFALLGWMLVDLLQLGASHLSFDFFFDEPENAGRAGGIAPVLVATLWLVAIALIAAVPSGLAAAVWLVEFARQDSAAARRAQRALDLLAGTPSIVFGLFGNAFFCVRLGLGFSILAGGLTLALMILPIFVASVVAGLETVDDGWRRGALALGMRRHVALAYILLPAAVPAIAAGLMLGLGRATAETAALIFTSGYVDRMPESLSDSGRALAIHIYDLSMNVAGGEPAAAASALTLVALVAFANLFALRIVRRVKLAGSPP